jgi:hypothetical protein
LIRLPNLGQNGCFFALQHCVDWRLHFLSEKQL